MNICLINGSPKYKDSTSGFILSTLEHDLGTEHHYMRFLTANGNITELIDALRGCDIIILSFPLYVDGIPAHLLRLLTDLESKIDATAKGATLYVTINNGFYEARQNSTALAMIRIFCEKSGLNWGQGVCIGGGGMLSEASLQSRIVRSIRNALATLAGNIQSKNTAGDLFVEPNIPRRLYIIGAHTGWRKHAKQNGIKL